MKTEGRVAQQLRRLALYVDAPGSEPGCPLLDALQPLASELTSLCLCFHIYEMGIKADLTILGFA